MQSPATAIIGLSLLLITVLAFYKLAPREGRESIAWLERENLALTVILSLFVLAVIGIGLIIRAIV